MYAQNSNNGNVISINAIIVDDNIPLEAQKNLLTKMQKAITMNGMGDNGYTERFVMTAKIDIIQKDIVPTTPARISEKLEVTFLVGDVLDNKLYESCSITVAGIGINENKALITAFQKIKANNSTIQEMLTKAKADILDYYTNHCTEIIQKAIGKSNTGNIDEAISDLIAVPNVCEECFERCQQVGLSIYQSKLKNETTELLHQAKVEWMKNPTPSGAKVVADIISNANPLASNYKDIVSFQQEISKKLSDDEKREWNFKMKQYEDNVTMKRDLIKSCRDIGVAWAKNQPKTIYHTIVRGWW